MLHKEYFVAKIGVDTAENEPLKVTDSVAGKNAEWVVSRLRKADLVEPDVRGAFERESIIQQNKMARTTTVKFASRDSRIVLKAAPGCTEANKHIDLTTCDLQYLWNITCHS